MEKIPMTAAGYSVLETELKHRQQVERPRIIQQITEARGHGDLSENAEFHAAKEKQSLLDFQIRECEDKIARAQVIDIAKLSGDRVVFGATVSLATAQQVLRNIIASQEKRVTIDLIQKRVSEHFNLREQDLKVRSNTRAIAFPRQVAMYIVKQLTTASLPEIGRQFGGKHHTTVLHSINKIETQRRSDKDLNRVITRLMDALQ